MLAIKGRTSSILSLNILSTVAIIIRYLDCVGSSILFTRGELRLIITPPEINLIIIRHDLVANHLILLTRRQLPPLVRSIVHRVLRYLIISRS